VDTGINFISFALTVELTSCVLKMSAPKRLSLVMPLDIDEIEIFQSNRQKLIEQKLMKCYAEEISSVISNLVVENCNGCIIDHPSQRQHPCLMMESDERLFLYFDEALSRISEAKIIERFMESLNEIKPTVNGLELLKYTCQDWRILFCTKQKQLLKQETFKLL
jgi:hypothetical protein